MPKPSELQGEVNPLKLIRVALGLSQSEFAGLLGVQSFTVSRWETGRSVAEFDINQLAALDAALASKDLRIKDFVSPSKNQQTQSA
jgi:transcriptional regulator with XRE-family HTH domain